MSAEDWILAAKTEEQRLLGEIMKTDLYQQLEAVRTVIALYQDKAASPAAAPVSTPATAPASERGYKTANYLRNASMLGAAPTPSVDAVAGVDAASTEAHKRE